jgi:hypothetical protein
MEACAKAVRNVLKEEFIPQAQRRSLNEGKMAKWENGKSTEHSMFDLVFIFTNNLNNRRALCSQS